MHAVIQQFVARPLRYAVKLVLHRPWLKRHVRDMIMRMPRLHRLVLRVMFQAPATSRARMSADQKNLSPDARRVHRALKQAIRTRR